MRRRDFVKLIGGVTAAWPLAARGQLPGKLPTIGFLGTDALFWSTYTAAFVQRLRELGWIEGRTIAIEYRWSEGDPARNAEIAAEFVRMKVDVILTNTTAARTVKQATSVIPIVFGLVASLNHPGGNITGVDIMSGELTGKRLELLARLVSADRTVAFLRNPSSQRSRSRAKDFEGAARSLNRRFIVVDASNDAELESVFSKLAENKVGGVVVENDPFFDSRREDLIGLTAQRSIPALYHIREFPVAGGLMSYGASLVDAYYQMGIQAGRFLRGANIADLPVLRPTKFELTLNLTTAKALGLDIPPSFLAIADEVIE